MVLSIPTKYESFLNSTMWLVDWILACTATYDESGPVSRGNETVLKTPHITRTGASPSGIG